MSDFNQFKVINSRLKKRFLLRKPNFSEASQQFLDLSQEFKKIKFIAGHCCLASARCEHSLGNTNMELQSLLQSARYFRDDGKINAAISAYRHAILIAPDSFQTIVYRELARMYEKEKRFNEAAITYEEASLFKEAANCHIDAENFDQALNCFKKIAKSFYTNFDLVSIFLLNLFIYDTRKVPFKLPIINTDCEDTICLNILLESLLLLIKDQEEDEEIKTEISTRLAKFLDGRQQNLLRNILYHRINEK